MLPDCCFLLQLIFIANLLGFLYFLGNTQGGHFQRDLTKEERLLPLNALHHPMDVPEIPAWRRGRRGDISISTRVHLVLLLDCRYNVPLCSYSTDSPLSCEPKEAFLSSVASFGYFVVMVSKLTNALTSLTSLITEAHLNYVQGLTLVCDGGSTSFNSHDEQDVQRKCEILQDKHNPEDE